MRLDGRRKNENSSFLLLFLGRVGFCHLKQEKILMDSHSRVVVKDETFSSLRLHNSPDMYNKLTQMDFVFDKF